MKFKQALTIVASLIAGGALIGGVALTAGAAGGASSPTGKSQSSAQYTAEKAWLQSIPEGGVALTSLNIPAGERLTITSASVVGSLSTQCGLTVTLNGATGTYFLQPTLDGEGRDSSALPFEPIYADSGSINCGPGGTTLTGYLTVP